jgi:hypothetical protein
MKSLKSWRETINRVIEIANHLLEQGTDEGIAIATGLETVFNSFIIP